MTVLDPPVTTAQTPVRPANRPTTGDRVFRAMTVTAAMLALAAVTATMVFLLRQARPAFSSTGWRHFFFSTVWNPSVGRFGVLGVMTGTVIVATIAMAIAVPGAITMALFINEYAPRRVGRALTTVIDLLAALPSLVFGMWGRDALQVHLSPAADWMSRHLVAIPVFRPSGDQVRFVGSSFVVGVVVGVMVLPIITSISRDVMAQVPREQCEGALALGGTRWGMIRAVVLPFGRSGIVGGILLGFGRALGETIAVALILSFTLGIQWHVLESGGSTVASLIAIKFGEATPAERSGLVAAGAALMLLTVTLNLVARRVVRREAVA